MDAIICNKLPTCIFHRNTCFGDSECAIYPSMKRWLGKKCQGNTGHSITVLFYQSPIQPYHNISMNKEVNQEHFDHIWEEYICKHLKQLMAALTGICYTAQTFLHYTNPSSSSQTRIPSVAAADEGFSHAETRLPHIHISQGWVYQLTAARGSGLWESQGFFPRHNNHRAASHWCCHLGKLFLEKQEKCVGWAEKTMQKLKQAEESSVIQKVKKIPMSAKIYAEEQISPQHIPQPITGFFRYTELVGGMKSGFHMLSKILQCPADK